MQFKPLRQRKFVETLTVRSGIGSVHVVLSGEGVSPSLQLTPESGLLDIGNVLQVRLARCVLCDGCLELTWCWCRCRG